MNREEAEFYRKGGILNIVAGEGITISGSDSRRPIISSTGSGSTEPHTHTFSDITGVAAVAQIPNLVATKITSGVFAIARIPTGTTATTVALGNHTHHASTIAYGVDSNVGAALANALTNGDNGKTLNSLIVNGIIINGEINYQSLAADSATEMRLSEVNGFNVKAASAFFNISGDNAFAGGSVSINSALNIRGNVNFQGGAINNLMLWKNTAGTIRPIYNHVDATDGELRLPKDAGTLARLEDLPIGVPTGGTNTTFLRGDGTWVVPTNTTYTALAQAEFTTGTATTVRGVSAQGLNRDIQAKIISYLLSLPNATAGNVLSIDTAGTGFEWKTI